MKQTAAALSCPAPLVELVERVFEGGDVPVALWERALLGPAREFLRRPGKEFRARLVEACWRLAGGAGEPPAELPLVLELLHAGSLIVDDIEDGSDERRGAPALHQLVGTPIALNTGNWLYFMPLVLLDRMRLPPAQTLGMYRAATVALARCHEGQALDLAVSVFEVGQADVPRVVSAATARKTGALMELASTLGAIAAGADRQRIAALAEFGRELGIGLQMLDDLGSVICPRRRDKGAEDLRHGRPTWAWAWLAESVDEVSFAKLQQLGRAGEVAQLFEAMRPALEPGRARVHAHLSACLDALTARVGAHPVIAAVAAEIDRLEKSYG
jgi:geranylgeranyl pyrophosphate synthase